MKNPVFILLSVLVLVCLCEAYEGHEELARVVWKDLEDGSVQLTITPVSSDHEDPQFEDDFEIVNTTTILDSGDLATDIEKRDTRARQSEDLSKRQEDLINFINKSLHKRQETSLKRRQEVKKRQDDIGFSNNHRKKRQEVKKREDTIDLRLKRDTKFNRDFKVIVDGVPTTSTNEDVDYYISPGDGSISVETERSAGRVRRYVEGEFFHNNHRYYIRRALRQRPGQQMHLMVKKRSRNPITGQIYTKANPSITKRQGEYGNEYYNYYYGGGGEEEESAEQGRLGPYYVELAVFTDVSVFLHTKRRSKTEDEKKIVKNIQHRVGHIIHGVDLAYRRMKTIDMSVWLKALYVSTEFRTSENVTINALNSESRPLWNVAHARQKCKADANKIRSNINEWLNQQTFTADHAVAFSMYDLWDLESNPPVDVVGQADFYNMCGEAQWRGSCVEWGSFHIWATVAHELAHNLNVPHDGQETSSDCRTNDFYVMTTDSAIHDRSTIDNGFRFSSCSEDAIRKTVEESRQEGRQCLSNKVTHHALGIGEHVKNHLPGQEYTLEQQCRIVYGDKSIPCVNRNDFEEICVILYCTNPSSGDNSCLTPGDFRAARGTPCADKKWCDEGKCVHDDRAKPYNPEVAMREMLIMV